MKHRAYMRVGVLFLIASMRIASTTAQIQYSVTTIAGVAGTPGQNNGQAQQALFDQPSDLAVASNGQIWVVDQQDRVLRRIFPDGRVTTFA